MPIGISHDTRNQVIREWLAGEPRDKIASDTELAADTIANTNIFFTNSQWIYYWYKKLIRLLTE